MLVSLKELNGTTISATDGEVGQVKDIYFDDEQWAIRFMVVDTHPWMPLSEKVLISPIALVSYHSNDKLLNVSLDKESVKNSPKIEEHEPLSRKFEKAYFDYFGYGYYWLGSDAWGQYSYPTGLFQQNMIQQELAENETHESLKKVNHLRSANEINHYGIDALDGNNGYIKDFIWDTENWTLSYLVIDTNDWLPGGKKVLISPKQVKSLNWEDKSVTCNISLAQIEACPEYHADKLNDAEYLKGISLRLESPV